MEHLFARYLVGECNLSALTAYAYLQSLRRLEKFTGKPASETEVADMRAFLRETTYHPSTKNSTLVALKAWHKWGNLEGYWPLNGLMSLRGPKLVRNPKPSLTINEARQLLDLCRRPNDYRVIYLGLYGGLRVSETTSIGEGEWLEDRLRFVGKGAKERDVPVHPELAARREIILSHHTTAATLKHTCRGLAFVSGIAFTSHALRRTAAVTMSEAGIPREVVGAVLGHSPASVTEFYAPVRWAEKREAISRLSY